MSSEIPKRQRKISNMMNDEDTINFMQGGYDVMTEEEKDEVLIHIFDRDWTPRAIMAEVKLPTEAGRYFLEAWKYSQNIDDTLATTIAKILGMDSKNVQLFGSFTLGDIQDESSSHVCGHACKHNEEVN